jgi:lipopolysaccharide export system ATP-binding protein
VKRYRARTVVNHVSIEVNQGEIVGLLGPNGAGKTTTFYMTVGLIKPDEGRVFINDQDITKLPMYKRAQMGIGYLPQEASVFRKLSVEDNINAVLEMTKLSKKEQKEKLESLIREFRLEHVRKSNGDIVSGGERRRTEIARALAVDPKFILLDEPFAGIDPIAVEDIQAIVAKLKYKNIGILITDHNVTETLSICDRAYLLIEGKIFKHGTAEELAEDDQVKKLYLGRNFELKRKDWLLEDTGKQRAPRIESVIQSVENGVEWFNQIKELQKEHEHSIGYGRSTGDDDLQRKDYIIYLEELKNSLRSFIKEHRDEELQSHLARLESAETFEQVVGDLNTMLFLLKSKA